MKSQETLNSQKILEKNKNGWRTLPNFKTYYQVIGMKTMQYWHENRQNKPTVEYNREPGNKPSHICPTVLDKRMPTRFKGDRRSLKESSEGELGMHTQVDPRTVIVSLWQAELTNMVEAKSLHMRTTDISRSSRLYGSKVITLPLPRYDIKGLSSIKQLNHPGL